MKKEIDNNEVKECVSTIIDICSSGGCEELIYCNPIMEMIEDEVGKYDDELKEVVLKKLLEEIEGDDGWFVSDVKVLKRIFTQFKNGEKR